MSAWATWSASLLVIVAAALAVDRAIVSTAHRPVALALCLAMLEPSRPDDGTAGRLLCIGLPALSAWLAVRVLVRSRWLALCGAAAVIACGLWRWGAWEEAPRWAAAASVLVQAVVVLAVVPRCRLRLSERCVVALAAGDVAAFLGPLGIRAEPPVQQAMWWIVQWQAAAIAAALCGLHVAQTLADRRRDAAAA